MSPVQGFKLSHLWAFTVISLYQACFMTLLWWLPVDPRFHRPVLQIRKLVARGMQAVDRSCLTRRGLPNLFNKELKKEMEPHHIVCSFFCLTFPPGCIPKEYLTYWYGQYCSEGPSDLCMSKGPARKDTVPCSIPEGRTLLI